MLKLIEKCLCAVVEHEGFSHGSSVVCKTKPLYASHSGVWQEIAQDTESSRCTRDWNLGGTLKKNLKESKSMVPEVVLPYPRGSRWENVKPPVWKLNSWPAGHYQLLLNIETSHEEEGDHVRWWGRERCKGIWCPWPAGPVSLASSMLAGRPLSDWTFRPRSYVDMDLFKARSQSVLKNAWRNVRIVVKMINI